MNFVLRTAHAEERGQITQMYRPCGASLRPAQLFPISAHLCRMSFVEVPEGHPFPIQNLPYGVFSTADEVTCSCVHAHMHTCIHSQHAASPQDRGGHW